MSDKYDEEPLELEPLEEAEFAPDKSVLAFPCVESAIRNYSGSQFPCCILDASLAIVWRNDAFQWQLPEVTQETANLVTYFPESFEERDRGALFSSLRSRDAGFSWRGIVQLYDRDKPKLVAHLLISPVLSREAPSAAETNERPDAYLGIVDDISEHRRDLVRATFSSLLEASLLKDNDTGHHVARVNEYSRVISEIVAEKRVHDEVDFEFVDTISFVAAMHDVGKIGTPDDILTKNGPLESWELDVMREYTKNGAYILATYPAETAKHIALFHHERWDGSGYPYQIAGEMIPLAARIVALADVYDAMRMKRTYKPAFPHEKTCEEIQRGIESHFDPTLAELFIERSDAMRDIYERLKDS